MGFGLNVKVEAPKVEVPKVDVASAVNSVTSAVSGAVDSAKKAANDAVNTATSAVNDAINTATSAANDAVSAATEAANAVVSVVTSTVASLTTVAGAIADVAVSFTGKIEDFALEPHLSLDANASYEETLFEKGPLRIRMEMTREEAGACTDTIHLFSGSKSFDVNKRISEFTDGNEKTVILLFDDVPMNEKYSLELIGEDGTSSMVLKDVAYGDFFKSKGDFLNPDENS